MQVCCLRLWYELSIDSQTYGKSQLEGVPSPRVQGGIIRGRGFRFLLMCPVIRRPPWILGHTGIL